MDEEEELKSTKRILFAVAMFLISSYFSYREFKYIAWGKTAEASVIETFETAESGRRGRKRPLLAVKYSFTDDSGQSWSERDDVPIGWEVPVGTVTVQYLSGVEDSSRIKGNSSTMSVWIFLGCIGWLGYMLFKLCKEANEPLAVSRRGR